MLYYVHMGNRVYGPANEATLQQWAYEHRISENTILEREDGTLTHAFNVINFNSIHRGERPYCNDRNNYNNPSFKGLNFGAFCFPLLWGLSMNIFWSLLCFIPIIHFFASFYFLFKGNELAWKHRRFLSNDDFKKCQKIWRNWAVAYCIFCFIFGIIFGFSN